MWLINYTQPKKALINSRVNENEYAAPWEGLACVVMFKSILCVNAKKGLASRPQRMKLVLWTYISFRANCLVKTDELRNIQLVLTKRPADRFSWRRVWHPFCMKFFHNHTVSDIRLLFQHQICTSIPLSNSMQEPGHEGQDHREKSIMIIIRRIWVMFVRSAISTGWQWLFDILETGRSRPV